MYFQEFVRHLFDTIFNKKQKTAVPKNIPNCDLSHDSVRTPLSLYRYTPVLFNGGLNIGAGVVTEVQCILVKQH